MDFLLRKREEELLFQRWIHDIQFQMSFDEFKEKLKPKPLRSDEEILDEVKDILDMFKR